MLVTNNTSQDYWFGPLHLLPNAVNYQVDDTTETSLYLTDDSVADAINNLSAAGKISVSSAAAPFPRPTGMPDVLHGDGSPEGVHYAPQGSVYLRRDGGDAWHLYVKSTAVTLDTGWLALPGQEFDYAQITANSTGITATTEGPRRRSSPETLSTTTGRALRSHAACRSCRRPRRWRLPLSSTETRRWLARCSVERSIRRHRRSSSSCSTRPLAPARTPMRSRRSSAQAH